MDIAAYIVRAGHCARRNYRSRQRTEAVGFREIARYGNWLGFTLNLQRPTAADASLPQTAAVLE
ncbi:MAG: hypothetical protein WCD69_01815 [Xanthobacteraceae bacterium]